MRLLLDRRRPDTASETDQSTLIELFRHKSRGCRKTLAVAFSSIRGHSLSPFADHQICHHRPLVSWMIVLTSAFAASESVAVGAVEKVELTDFGNSVRGNQGNMRSGQVGRTGAHWEVAVGQVESRWIDEESQMVRSDQVLRFSFILVKEPPWR